jgi:hypothetical protein
VGEVMSVDAGRLVGMSIGVFNSRLVRVTGVNLSWLGALNGESTPATHSTSSP